MRKLVAALLVVAASGCGTIMHGSWQDMNVDCSNQSAVVTIDGKEIRPGKVRLRREDHHLVRAEAAGTKTAAVFVDNDLSIGCMLVDVLLTSGVGVLVDAITGGWYNLDPTSVTLVMEPDPDATAATNAKFHGPDAAAMFCTCGFRVRPETKCSNCGQQAIGEPRGGGAPSAAKPASAATTKRAFCSSCGTPIEAGKPFCSSCGAKQ